MPTFSRRFDPTAGSRLDDQRDELERMLGGGAFTALTSAES
jgi:hypothetical protein